MRRYDIFPSTASGYVHRELREGEWVEVSRVPRESPVGYVWAGNLSEALLLGRIRYGHRVVASEISEEEWSASLGPL